MAGKLLTSLFWDKCVLFFFPQLWAGMTRSASGTLKALQERSPQTKRFLFSLVLSHTIFRV